MLDLILEHLTRLVGFDTTNPPRAIAADSGIVAYAATVLERAGYDVERRDLGDGCITLLARRGATRRLFNVHLDTVPVVDGWTGSPHRLEVGADRAVGLGACDIKGAAAALLAAAGATGGDSAILLTTDEEAGTSRCVREFLDANPGAFDEVVVAEPTGCRAVTAHRGLISADAIFHGRAAHASSPDASEGNALHHAVRWSSSAVAWSDSIEDGARLNVGVLEGGTKPNIAAARARVAFGLRPPPGLDGDAMLQLQALSPPPARVEWSTRFAGPSLAATPGADALARSLGVDVTAPVDFWTEASLFAERGAAALVFGPGSIDEAHTADESVPLDDLLGAATVYQRAFGGS